MERKTKDIRAAQRQALDLLQQQRAALRTQERIRNKMRLQRKRWAELVVLTGADHLDDAQLVAALLRAAEDSRNPALREEARLTGEAYLQRRPLPPHLT